MHRLINCGSRFSLSLSQGRQKRPISVSGGFTLLELLVVIAIIGMMTAVVAVNGSAARAQSRDATRKSNLSLVGGALQIYFSEQRSYPASPTAAWSTVLKPVLYPTYISQWPADPLNPTTDGTPIGSKNGFSYQTNQAGIAALNNVPAASLYALDVTLEGKDTATLTQASDFECIDATKPTFYVTGVFQCSDGKFHDRISSR